MSRGKRRIQRVVGGLLLLGVLAGSGVYFLLRPPGLNPTDRLAILVRKQSVQLLPIQEWGWEKIFVDGPTSGFHLRKYGFVEIEDEYEYRFKETP